MNNETDITLINNTRKKKLNTLLVKLHRAYSKQKNKKTLAPEVKFDYIGGYNAIKMIMLIFENVSNFDDLKNLVKIEVKRYKELVEKSKSTTDVESEEYYTYNGYHNAFRRVLAATIYIDELDVDNHNILRDEVINFEYAG